MLLNAFLLEKKYKGTAHLSPYFIFFCISSEASQICIDLMLQDDDDDHLTRALAINACYNFYLIAKDEDFKSTTTEEEDEDIVCIE